jgi:hypothetical protein
LAGATLVSAVPGVGSSEGSMRLLSTAPIDRKLDSNEIVNMIFSSFRLCF